MVIQKLILQTGSPDLLAAFYKDVLQLPVERSKEHITISAGISEIVFEQAVPGADPFYHFAFTIPANKILEAKQWLLSKVELIWMEEYNNDVAEFANWHARSVYFYDPAGNIVELIARAALNNNVEESFSSRQILSVSEAGLVFKEAEFEKQTDRLISGYTLSYFDKQPPLPQFRALGDDEGLFIVVPEHRNWYPTQKASGIYPMEIRFSIGESKYVWKTGG